MSAYGEETSTQVLILPYSQVHVKHGKKHHRNVKRHKNSNINCESSYIYLSSGLKYHIFFLPREEIKANIQWEWNLIKRPLLTK